jgi:molybdopterin synthase catalytic subunit
MGLRQLIDITEADFSIDEVVKKARSGDVGAIVTFLGTVRNDDIKSMELEAYKEVAISELERMRDEAVSRFHLRSVDIIHRIGSLSIGDNIVLIVCAAGHRKEAFDGCSYIIEELKVRVPIWKKEIKDDGHRWVSGQ